MCKRALGLAAGWLAFELAMCGCVLAEEAGQTISWQLRAVPGLTAKARIKLAKAGKPIWHAVSSNQGSTLREVVAEVCGDQPAETVEVLISEASRLNLIEDPDAIIEKDVAVAVPFCLKVEQNVPVEIKSGDTLEKILKENYGFSGKKTYSYVFEANKAQSHHKDFDDFARSLQVGEELLVPKAEPRVFSPRSGVEASLESVLVESHLSESARSQIESSSVTVSEPEDSGGYQFRTIDSVEFESAEAYCAPPGETASIVDLDLLTERFTKEEQAKRQFDEENAQSVIVGIIDSGLAEVGDNFFKLKFFAPNPKEFQKTPNVDDDRNNFIDDIYGINFNTSPGTGEIRPYPTSGGMKSHGTKMAALILGGLRASEWMNSRQPPPIRLKVVNFASSKVIGANVDPDKLGQAIKYLKDQGAKIINMSLANEQNVAPADNGIQLQPDVLFVVAAGNAKSGSGRDLDLEPQVFPARYGGRQGFHRAHVITVGAADLAGKRADFSNHSRQYVDLLAPGCAVETRDDVGKTVVDSGTSPATAITSFAAALVSSLGLREAAAIKNRLLFSTDPDPALADTSWSSGRLNIVKAISLRNDVIALLPSGYNFQKVDTDKLRRFCADQNIRDALYRSDIRKVVPNIPGTGRTEIEFWYELNETLERKSCAQDSSAIEAHITFSDSSQGPSLTDIRDITFASF